MRFWFSLCCIRTLWFLAHTYGFLSKIYIGRFQYFGNIIKLFLASLIVCPLYCLRRFCLDHENHDVNSFDHGIALEENHDVDKFDHKMALENLTKNIRRLWFQYCKLYVVGYTECDDTTESIKTIIIKSTDNAIKQQENEKTNRDNESQECDSDCHCNESFSNSYMHTYAH